MEIVGICKTPYFPPWGKPLSWPHGGYENLKMGTFKGGTFMAAMWSKKGGFHTWENMGIFSDIPIDHLLIFHKNALLFQMFRFTKPRNFGMLWPKRAANSGIFLREIKIPFRL